MDLLQGPLCLRCSCETEEEEERRQLGRRNAGQPFDAAGGEILVPPAYAPKERGFPTYASAANQPLLGVPVREGGLWHLTTQDRFEPVTVALHVNGLSISSPGGSETSVSLSPFSLIRNCRFQSGACAQLKSFKVSFLDHDPCYYFAVRSVPEREAEEERSDWVLGLSHMILLITDSLLPRFSVSCDPLPSVWQTRARLMAGYLIHQDDAASVSVLFCELQAHSDESARFVMYEDESCEMPIMDVIITDESVCCDIVGINCSCFIVDCHHFASQSPSERKLWLRALSNVKVKIQNRAPAPTDKELEHYRESIREHIAAAEATAGPSRISQDALLPRGPRKCLQTVGDGDVETPSPSLKECVSQQTEMHQSL